MPSRSAGAALRGFRSLFDAGTAAGLADGPLLRRFAEGRGEAAEQAFAALVERHGPMVLRVCRSVLRDEHEAHDAFQAAFFVLARSAGSLWVRDSLGPWLYRVARRIALRHRRLEARRKGAEEKAAEAAARSRSESSPDDLDAVCEEIDRLPSRYRDAVVLCDLEGCSHERAATLLGWPVGTVKSRQARGRSRLRAGLTRRGLGAAAGLAAGDLLVKEAFARPSVALTAATARSATLFAARPAAAGSATASTLAKGVLMGMTLTKWRAAAVIAAGIGITSLATAVTAEQAGTPARSVTESERLLEVEAGLDRLLRDTEAGASKAQLARSPEEPRRPIVRLLMAVDYERNESRIVLEELMTRGPNGAVEVLHFSTDRGRAFRPDGSPIVDDDLWRSLEPARSGGVPVVVASGEGILKTPYVRLLARDAIILVGASELRKVEAPRAGSPPASSTVGVVDMDAVMKRSKLAQRDSKEFQAKHRERRTQLNTLQQQASRVSERLDGPGAVQARPVAETEKLRRELDDLNLQIEAARRRAEREFHYLVTGGLSTILAKSQAAAGIVAEQRGIMFVVRSSNPNEFHRSGLVVEDARKDDVQSAGPRSDITDDVIALLDRRFDYEEALSVSDKPR